MKKSIIGLVAVVVFLLLPSICLAADCTASYDMGTGCYPDDDCSGSISTAETSKTYTAAAEVLNLSMQLDSTSCTPLSVQEILDSCSDDCCSVICGPVSARACTDGVMSAGLCTSSCSYTNFGTWDVVCEPDAYTVYGTISGDVQEGVNVGIYRPNCGGDVLLDTATTNSEGYYSFDNLSDGWHTVVPELSGYTFAPETDYPKIPQTEIQSYDFTATAD